MNCFHIIVLSVSASNFKQFDNGLERRNSYHYNKKDKCGALRFCIQNLHKDLNDFRYFVPQTKQKSQIMGRFWKDR